MRRIRALTIIALLLCVGEARAQVRIATYNTLDKPFDALSDGQFTTIFHAIGESVANGVAKRVDILALQEQTNQIGNNTAARIAGLLNAHYGVVTFQASVVGGGADKVAYVYDSSTMQAVGSTTFIIGSRPAHRMQFRPVGYTSADADLYLYDVHLNASSAATRASEVTNLRANADALASTLEANGRAANFIYVGDFNFGSSNEAGFGNLTGAGAGQGIDPTGLAGWPSSTSEVAKFLSQSTRTASLPDGGAAGGLDDRFDLQITTADLLDGAGVNYIGPTTVGMNDIDHSYRAFGNDGTSYNMAITLPVADRSQSAAVLQALHDFSDHLPVIADYQIPAKMDATTGPVPLTLTLGEMFQLEVIVSNGASVLAPVGADELNYSLISSGDVTGNADGLDVALGGGNSHFVSLDTTSLGTKSGLITISSNSEGVENGLISLPIEFEVIAATVLGDYNGNGFVDAADYTVWRNTVGSTSDFRADGTGPSGTPDQVIDSLDYDFWKQNYGEVAGSRTASSNFIQVPEPTLVGSLLGVMICSAMTSLRLRSKQGL